MENIAVKPSATEQLWATVEKLGRTELRKLGWTEEAIQAEIEKRALKRAA